VINLNTKKIWILAIGFGLLMSIFFYAVTAAQGNNKQSEENAAKQEDNDATPTKDEEDNTGLGIASGKRALSIAVTEVQSVSAFVTPGSYVDVISISPVPAGEGSTAQILLQHVKVLAVGSKVTGENNESQEAYQMVTLEVTPGEGTALAFAKEAGVVTLMLNGTKEQASSQPITMTMDQLKKGQMPQ
jgi:pilus assembly protein CpaB